MKKSVRLLAMLLCVLSIVALLPTTALAAEPDSVKQVALQVADKFLTSKEATAASNSTSTWTVYEKTKCELSVSQYWYVGSTPVSVKFQWYVKKAGSSKWVKISGATKYIYKFTATRGKNNWRYRCKITVKSGSYKGKYAWSNVILLKVKKR